MNHDLKHPPGPAGGTPFVQQAEISMTLCAENVLI
jgi:hypothetical protein